MHYIPCYDIMHINLRRKYDDIIEDRYMTKSEVNSESRELGYILRVWIQQGKLKPPTLKKEGRFNARSHHPNKTQMDISVEQVISYTKGRMSELGSA